VQAYGALLKAGVELPPWLDFISHWMQSNRPELCSLPDDLGQWLVDDNKFGDMMRAMNKASPDPLITDGPTKLGPFPQTDTMYIALKIRRLRVMTLTFN